MTLSINKLVCGVDFSPASVAALEMTAFLAAKHGAEADVLHAYTVPTLPFVESGVIKVDEDRIVTSLARDLRKLVADTVGASHGFGCRILDGPPADALLRAASAANADLIVIGTRGLTGLPRFMLGSVAERVVRMATTSVLVVPEPDHAAGPRAIKAVLAGVDFSAPCAAAMRTAIDLARAYGAALHLVHAWQPGLLESRRDEAARQHRAELEQRLEAEARSVLEDSPPAELHVRRGVPYVALADAAREVGADLLVVGSTGRSGLAQFLVGGVAERVLRASPVPVLVVREQ